MAKKIFPRSTKGISVLFALFFSMSVYAQDGIVDTVIALQKLTGGMTRAFDINLSTGALFGGAINGVIRSTDGGFAWTTVASGMTPYGICVDQSNGDVYAAGDTSGVSKAILWKSTNNGANWTRKYLSGQSPSYFSSICMKGDTLFATYVQGSSLKILMKSLNGGTNWSMDTVPASSPPSTYFIAVTSVPDFLHISGDAAVYQRNNSQVWQAIPANFTLHSPVTHFIDDIFFVGGNDGLSAAIGYYSPGAGWTTHTLSDGGQINSIALSGNTGFGIGYGNSSAYLYRSFDNTEKYPWHFVCYLPYTGAAIKVYGNALYIYAYGAFIIYNIDNLDNALHKIPQRQNKNSIAVLGQNFPNPYNPVTRIKYSLLSGGPVKLQVYNSAGIMVSELTNTYQASGNYEVNFSGQNLASGPYFYRLEVNGVLIDTRKMLLIK